MEIQATKKQGKKRRSSTKRKSKSRKTKGTNSNKTIQEVSNDMIGLDSIARFQTDFTSSEKRERYRVI